MSDRARAQPPERKASPYRTAEDARSCGTRRRPPKSAKCYLLAYLRGIDDITVYEKTHLHHLPQPLITLLEERGIDFERVNYHVDPLPEEKIRELVRRPGAPPRTSCASASPRTRSTSKDVTRQPGSILR